MGYTQVQVAKELGISKQVYNNYELGKRQADYETLLKLSEFYDTTVENLLTGNAEDEIDCIYSKIGELCDLNNITLDELEEKTGVNIDKAVDGYRKKMIPKESIFDMKTIADYFGVVSSYFTGYPDDLETAKLLVGKEEIGNQRVVDLADRLISLDNENRDYFLDIFEKILNKYYKMLEQIDK